MRRRNNKSTWNQTPSAPEILVWQNWRKNFNFKNFTGILNLFQPSLLGIQSQPYEETLICLLPLHWQCESQIFKSWKWWSVNYVQYFESQIYRTGLDGIFSIFSSHKIFFLKFSLNFDSSLQQTICLRPLNPHFTISSPLLFLNKSITNWQFESNWQIPFEPSRKIHASPESFECWRF